MSVRANRRSRHSRIRQIQTPEPTFATHATTAAVGNCSDLEVCWNPTGDRRLAGLCGRLGAKRPVVEHAIRRWSVLGELYSWSQTIQELHDVVANRDWRSLNDHDRRRLLGLTPAEVWWALLGRMRPSAMKSVFGSHLASIQEIVQRVAVEPESAFPDVAVRAYAQLTGFDGIGPGIATRLLTLARPDRFVSLNGASRAGLAASFAVAPSTLSQPRKYGRLLEQVYGKAWYSDPDPVDAREETIRWMRAALIDCFVYEP